MSFGRRRADWLLLGIAALCGLLAWLFVRLGSQVVDGDMAHVDTAIRQFVMERRSPVGTALFEAITMLGSKPILAVLAIIAGWWISKRSKAAVILLALCAFGSAEYVSHLKEEFSIARPPIGGATSRSHSFPSGHTSGAAAMVTLLCYVAWRRRKAVSIILPAGIVLVGLIAVSRVYLDKHWLSDTIGGALIGVALGLAGCALYEWISRHEARPDERRATALPPENPGST